MFLDIAFKDVTNSEQIIAIFKNITSAASYP